MALVVTLEPEVRSVRLDYTAPAGTVTVTFARTGPSGTIAAVRGWQDAPAEPGPVIARDFEAPIGVPLDYTVQAFDVAGELLDTAAASLLIASLGCDDTWLTDLARATNTLRVVVQALPELEYLVPVSVHDVITRRDPIVSSDVAHTPEFELAFLTDTLEQRDQARTLLGNGIPVLLRTPSEQGIGNLYFSVLGYSEERVTSLGAQPARRFTVDGRQVRRPDPQLYAPVGIATYGHVRDSFATYQDLLDERASYDAVLYDWTGAEPSDVVPWPPDDV